ncbi:MAG: hypothetical protein ACK5OB_20080 [Pirellula sp.]
MQTIRRQIQLAWRRLWLQNALHALGWTLLICFSVCFLVLLVPKILYVDYTFESLSRIALTLAATSAVAIAALIAWWRQPTELRAAVELDQRFGLRERASSAMNLPEIDRESAAGRALLEDAANKLQNIDVRDGFPVRPAPQLAWTLLPLAACLALFWVADAPAPSDSKLASANSESVVNVKNTTAPLLKAVQKKREEAESQGDEESAEQFKRLEDQIRSLQNKAEADPKKVIADLNELKKELQQKRDSLGSADQMKKTMESLKAMENGPAEKLAKALQDGDLEKADRELGKMLDALKSGELSAEQAKQLEKQLDQMQKAMAEAKQEREQRLEEAKRELEKAEKEGNVEKAANLRKKLEQLEKADSQCQNGDKLGEKMAKAQQALKEGNQAEAAAALEEMQSELEEMLGEQQASDELQEMLDQIDDAKSASKCQSCKGAGCKECEGGNKDGKDGKGKGKGKGKGEGKGDGEGEGQGVGDRDEKEADYKNYDAQVREEMRKGETVNGGKAGGKNRKGVSREETREAVLSSEPDRPDAIESIQLPKAQRDQVKEFFDSLRDDK